MHLLLAKTANSLRIKTAFLWWPLSQVGLGENGMGVQSINYSLVPEQSREQRLFTFLPSVILGSCVWGTWESAREMPKTCQDCCCSLGQLCLTLWDPMHCGRPGFPVWEPLIWERMHFSPWGCIHSGVNESNSEVKSEGLGMPPFFLFWSSAFH